jgi:putative FmdB family regulatory protein
MPIYAYRCSSCGHAQDVLRKISDPPLNVCPACGAATFVKQVTAAGFQLKGSGWYVTDFRDKKAAKPGADGADKTTAAEPVANGAAKPADGAVTSDAAKPAEAAKSAPAPAVAPAPAAASSPSADKGKA